MQSHIQKLFKTLSLLLFLNYLICIETQTNLKSETYKLNSTKITQISKSNDLPVDTTFKFPAPLPLTPPGEGNFSKLTIDLGGLEVTQLSISPLTSQRVYRSYEGGPDNMGFTIFNPSNLTYGYSKLGFYAQPNNRQLFGWILVAKDISGTTLKPSVDYIELGNTATLNIKEDAPGYFWQPVCPDGYKPVGLSVTNSPQKPVEFINCVRSDFTEESENDFWLWSFKETSVWSLRPVIRGTEATGVYTGTFNFQQPNLPPLPSPLSCLKNSRFDLTTMPDQAQIKALFQGYSPWVYLHPDEQFLTSSVNWYFANGALLYQLGNESNPVTIKPDGSDLPQGGSDDGLFWLDYPIDKLAKENIKRGDLNKTKAYLHIKPMYGGTFTDIVVWLFYPFNGNARLKFLFIKSLSLGDIGEHIGDWEHVTLRISNFNGELWRVYFAEHSGGTLMEACDVEFKDGNKPVTYSSFHGHAMFAKPGLVLQGEDGNGLRNDMSKSDKLIDTGFDYEVIAGPRIVEPAWVNYFRKWGPVVRHDIDKTLDGIAKALPRIVRKRFRNFITKIPREVLIEDGPIGPKVKRSWTGDE